MNPFSNIERDQRFCVSFLWYMDISFSRRPKSTASGEQVGPEDFCIEKHVPFEITQGRKMLEMHYLVCRRTSLSSIPRQTNISRLVSLIAPFVLFKLRIRMWPRFKDCCGLNGQRSFRLALPDSDASAPADWSGKARAFFSWMKIKTIQITMRGR